MLLVGQGAGGATAAPGRQDRHRGRAEGLNCGWVGRRGSHPQRLLRTRADRLLALSRTIDSLDAARPTPHPLSARRSDAPQPTARRKAPAGRTGSRRRGRRCPSSPRPALEAELERAVLQRLGLDLEQQQRALDRALGGDGVGLRDQALGRDRVRLVGERVDRSCRAGSAGRRSPACPRSRSRWPARSSRPSCSGRG